MVKLEVEIPIICSDPVAFPAFEGSIIVALGFIIAVGLDSAILGLQPVLVLMRQQNLFERFVELINCWIIQQVFIQGLLQVLDLLIIN